MKIVIGRSDKVDFPEFALKNIDIKVDTGAYTSTIHSHYIEEFTDENEQQYLQFSLLDPSHSQYNEKIFKTKNYKKKIVKSSFGASEERYVINTQITLFETTFPIVLTLSERTNMKFPILLGRKFLNQKFIVDTTKKNLSYKNKEKIK